MTLSKGKILVVDDDRLVLATLVHGLAQAGYDIIDADNGDDAILMARQEKPDLALLDIRMEGKSGFDVAEYLRDYCRIPFMFLSAFTDDATVKQVKALGAVAYLVKPLDIRQIVPAVESAFANLAQLRASLNNTNSPVELVDDKKNPSGLEENLYMELSVAMAVGVLMHRYSLDRHAAHSRLQRIAQTESRSLREQAEKVLQAVEVLSLSSE
jgi:two-component system, response regulator PdtaR